MDVTRRVAGAAIREGWNLAPITADTGVHVTDVDLSAIAAYEDVYLEAVADHLALTPWWARAGGRWVAAKLTGLWQRRRLAAAGAPAPVRPQPDEQPTAA